MFTTWYILQKISEEEVWIVKYTIILKRGYQKISLIQMRMISWMGNRKSRSYERKNKYINKILEHPIITTCVGFLLSCIGVYIGFSIKMFLAFNASEAVMRSQIDNLIKVQDQFIDYQTANENLKTEVAKVTGILEQLDKRLEQVEGYNTLILQGFSNASVKYAANDKEIYLSAPDWKSNQIIAIDAKLQKKYTTQELVNQSMLLYYYKDDQTIIFKGKFNDNIHWDGNCSLNVYNKKGDLTLVMDALYSDGDLLTYKQVIPFKTQQGNDVWIVSNRIVDKTGNSGLSLSFLQKGVPHMNFNVDMLQVSDFIEVNSFPKECLGVKESLYQGKTKNGFYCDDTGNAYLVKFSENAYVRTLYYGGFKKGVFDDLTGDAWYITKGENTNYMYYRGKFKDGVPVNDKNSEFVNDLTINDIHNIIKQYSFLEEFEWDCADD